MKIISGKLKKGRQYNQRRIPYKKKTDQLDLVPFQQVDQVVAPNSDLDITSWKPNKRTLELILDALQRKDAQELFAEPVNPAQVEDYYEIIKDPMDFGTMRAKLHEDMYQSLHQFEHDVFLIFKNAMHFNSSGTVYFKHARSLNDMATNVFHSLRTHPHKFELELELELDTTKRTSSAPKIYSGDRDSYLTKGDLTMSYGGSIPIPLELISKEEISYKESLVEFVKDLGPTAKRVAERKLQEVAESSKLLNHLTNIPTTTDTTIINKDCHRGGTKRKSLMGCKIMNKKIVLAVPATRYPNRRSRAYKSAKTATETTTPLLPQNRHDHVKDISRPIFGVPTNNNAVSSSNQYLQGHGLLGSQRSINIGKQTYFNLPTYMITSNLNGSIQVPSI